MKNYFLIIISSLLFVLGLSSNVLAATCVNDTDCSNGQVCVLKSGSAACFAATDVFYCLVRNNPNNCKVFAIENNRDFTEAFSACDNRSTDPNQGGLTLGKCPGSSGNAPAADIGPLAGATVESLKGQAVSVLNKANFGSPIDLINRAIRILLAFIGSISLMLYVWSGFLWMTASGNSDKLEKAKMIMIWTTLGVVMMLGSYMLASFIFKSLGV